MPENPDYLTRKQTSRYLTQQGIPASPATLADWGYRGKGPPYYRIDNGNALYKQEEVDRWLATSLRPGRGAK